MCTHVDRLVLPGNVCNDGALANKWCTNVERCGMCDRSEVHVDRTDEVGCNVGNDTAGSNSDGNSWSANPRDNTVDRSQGSWHRNDAAHDRYDIVAASECMLGNDAAIGCTYDNAAANGYNLDTHGGTTQRYDSVCGNEHTCDNESSRFGRIDTADATECTDDTKSLVSDIGCDNGCDNRLLEQYDTFCGTLEPRDNEYNDAVRCDTPCEFVEHSDNCSNDGELHDNDAATTYNCGSGNACSYNVDSNSTAIRYNDNVGTQRDTGNNDVASHDSCGTVVANECSHYNVVAKWCKNGSVVASECSPGIVFCSSSPTSTFSHTVFGILSRSE